MVRERHLAGPLVDHVHGHAGEVDEHLLASEMLLAHDDIELPAPLAIESAEARVAVAPLGILLAVLLPQQLQGHAAPLELPVDHLEVGLCPVPAPDHRRIQPGLQLRIVQVLGQWPHEPRRLGSRHHVVHRGRAHPAARRRLP